MGPFICSLTKDRATGRWRACLMTPRGCHVVRGRGTRRSAQRAAMRVLRRLEERLC